MTCYLMNDFIGSGGGGCAESHPTQTYDNRESTDGRTAAAASSDGKSFGRPSPPPRACATASDRRKVAGWGGRRDGRGADSAARTFQ